MSKTGDALYTLHSSMMLLLRNDCVSYSVHRSVARTWVLQDFYARLVLDESFIELIPSMKDASANKPMRNKSEASKEDREALPEHSTG